MPLLDIAISQPCLCFGNSILAFRFGTRSYNNIITGNDRKLGFTSTFSWGTFKLDKNNKLGRVVMLQGGLMIKAVATLDISTVACKTDVVKGHENVFRIDIDPVRSKPPVFEPQSSSDDSTEVGEREQLRRMRISKANKGNTPWNKGRKHSAETLQRIKERTRLAMQDPKVKMKLVNLGHAQSEDTKIKIGVGVRLGWERRREKLMLQETCYYEWKNLVAFAARKGILGEEELQWDSYKIINEQLEKEWLHSVEQRKKMPRPKGSKRAPKSAAQKRKISAAIAAKWADPEYRGRVCTGLAKFHGITEGAERKPTRKPRNDVQTQKNQKRKDEADNFGNRESKSQSLQRGRSKSPLYKDPLANSKLEMLLDIKAKRATTPSKHSDTITRARLLIYEAEKAAEALETAAQNSPLAQASLKESRMLISEAIQFIESIENEGFLSFEKGDFAKIKDGVENQIEAHNHQKVNGFHSISSANSLKGEDLGFVLVKENSSTGLLITDVEELQQITTTGSHSLELDIIKDQSFSKMNPYWNAQKAFANRLEFKPVGHEAPGSLLKKWVRGRLVEVQG